MTATEPGYSPTSRRLLSLDAMRGFIMIMLAASGFGISRMAKLPATAPVWEVLDYEIWQRIAFQFTHPAWVSRTGFMGVSFWDLIQPAFMFMVGVAMPFSYRTRKNDGSSGVRRFAHAFWRAIVLVLLGVLLQSFRTKSTNWIFTNVLAQIGLGYIFVYILMHFHKRLQIAAFVGILIGSWYFMDRVTVPENYDFAAVGVKPDEGATFDGRFAVWSKNVGPAFEVEKRLLNWFPRPNDKPWSFHSGGYLTLNFIPSIATMLLGVFAGQLLISKRRDGAKIITLLLWGAASMLVALVADQFVCPIVKRTWTPSWVLFSGAWVLWMLAVFYLLFDLLPLRWIAFPFVVVGMNSIAMYLMGQMMRPWTTKVVETHFRKPIEWLVGDGAFDPNKFGSVVGPTGALVVFWLIAFWMYRHRYFVRI